MIKVNKKFENTIDYIISATLVAPLFISIFSYIFHQSIRVSSVIIFFAVGILILFYLLSRPKIDKHKFPIALSALLIIYFLINKLVIPDTQYNILQLGFYVILPILVIQQDFNFEKILKITTICSIPLIFFSKQLLSPENIGLNQANMYVTYSFLPPIIASFTHLLFYANRNGNLIKHKKKNFIMILGYILNIYYCIQVCKTAVRGFWLALIIYVLFVLVIIAQKKLRKKTYYSVLALISLFITVVILNIEKLTNYLLQNIDDSVDNIGLLLKMQHQLSKGDLLNGRGQIWEKSIQYFTQSPFVGNGIESMQRLSGGLFPYPHNYFLQLIQDCGILSLTLIFSSIYSLYKFFRYEFYNRKNILLYLLTITSPLLLSGDIWKSSSLWLFLGYSVRFITRKEYEQDEN